MIITREQLKKHSGCDYYDGILLHARWAYQICGPDKVLPIGNIIAFRSPMVVDNKYMVDVEDRIAKDFIHSEDAINFVWELPEHSAISGVYFQRLFATTVGNILLKYINENNTYNKRDLAQIEIDGDDILVHDPFTNRGVTQLKGKASVSISCVRNNAILGHLGINVNAGDKAPIFAYSSKLADHQCEQFMVDCNNAFYAITKDCFIATTKTI